MADRHMDGCHYRERDRQRGCGEQESKNQNERESEGRQDLLKGRLPMRTGVLHLRKSPGRSAWRVSAPSFGGGVCLLKRQN